jgi:trimeric autotransporter adhesin
VTGVQTCALPISRTKVDFAGEPQNTAPVAGDVTVTNFINTVGSVKDHLVVVGTAVANGDVVSVYTAATGGTKLGFATVAAVGGTPTATIDLTTNLPAIVSPSTTGKVYVAVKSTGKNESDRVAVTYNKEPQTTAVLAGAVTVTNGYGAHDSAVVTGLQKFDVVKIYKNDGTATTSAALTFGTATVSTVTTSAAVTLTDLGTKAGSVYVTLTRAGYTESARTAVAYSAEAQNADPDQNTNNVKITNNVTILPTMYINGLTVGDTVKVYQTTTTAAIATKSSVTAAAVLFTIPAKYLTNGAGSLYVTIKSADKVESKMIAMTYAAKAQSTAPSTITVNNWSDVSDVVTVTGLQAGDTVKVWNSATDSSTTALIVKGTIKSTSTKKSISLNIPNSGTKKLAAAGGTIYVSVTSDNMLESTRTSVVYAAEPN